MNKKILIAMAAMVVGFIMSLLVQADSNSVTANANSTNYDPTVDSCGTTVSSTSPTESSNTTVLVVFNVTDINGPADLNNSLAKVEFDDNSTEFLVAFNNSINASCSSSDPNATTRRYECNVPFEYWQPSGNYSLRCYGGDKNDSIRVTRDNTSVLQYIKLVASSVDFTTIGFGTITSASYNTNITDIYSPINITNTGNVQLTTVSVTGANLSAAGRADIDISNFRADDTTSSQTAQQLTTSKQQITGVTVPVEDTTAGGNDDSLWAFFVVPSRLESGSYSGTWTLFEEQ